MSKQRITFWTVTGFTSITIPLIVYAFIAIADRVHALEVSRSNNELFHQQVNGEVKSVETDIKYLRENGDRIVALLMIMHEDIKKVDDKLNNHIIKDYGNSSYLSPKVTINRGEEIKENKKER